MVVQELGRGVHGKVKLCRDTTTDELCAIKIVDKTTRRRLGRSQASNEQKIRREIAIMKKCIHPHVVRLIEVIDDPTARKIYLVIEYMEGGEVKWKDPNECPILPLGVARTIFRDIVLGLEYLHMQGIIHRDIKPANLLKSADGSVKISDFGVSHFSEKTSLERDLENSPIWGDDLELAKTAGSPAFFAPELCHASTLQCYNAAIDIWALGVTLYCFVFGRCPFIADTEFELFNIIPRKPLSFPEGVPGRETVDAGLKDLLSRLLEKDVYKRITLKEVKEHPWVTEDIADPVRWRIETDPMHYQRVHVTEDEVQGAVKIMDRIKNRIRKLSVSLSNFTINRRRSKSISSTHAPGKQR
ncbi:kinase-like domain-containing protein [Linnemannia elongata]|nr:kinase-like domain-containing protein [Linnemannia elongata]